MRAVNYIFVLFVVVSQSCQSQDLEMSPSRSLKYLALGDSYTIGERVPSQESYPFLLKDTLEKAGISIAELKVIARTGWTTGELNSGIDNAELNGPYDFVTLLIGVNNQYRGMSLISYREEFAGLLSRALDFAGGDAGKVLVLSIPDWGVTPFAQGRDREKIAMEIDAFNLVKLQETQKAGIDFVNVTAISRLASENPQLLAPDGLHPSGVMYKKWVELMFSKVYEVLKTSD